MTEFMFDLNPVQTIVADAVGEPGKRTFFLQARAGADVVSLVLEKQEVNSLALSVLQLLEELESQFPDLPPASTRGYKLSAEQPLRPAFRVGELSIGYDESDDMIWLVAKALVVNDEGAVVDPDEEEVPSVRFVAPRGMMRAMSEHALEVISQGRPTCPLCGRPIDRGGHFCPRSDGQAVPVIF
jgi:uncharacterized repeat protein (TIGR03847 family)